MKTDVLNWLRGQPGDKRPSKETLNHPGLIELASGCDVFNDTAEAYRLAYESLGIDIINVVPETNAPSPLEPGQIASRQGGHVQASYLGVFDSTSRVRFPYATEGEFWSADFTSLQYDDLDPPGAQYLMPCSQEAIERKMHRIGEAGIYYYQLYTTLFMWGVETLGWEIFMYAVMSDPDRFDRHFLTPVFEKTKQIVTMLTELDTPWVYCHDDIATATGPVFNPSWYEQYIYPRYVELWKIPHSKGKKVMFVADGKLDWALPALRETGCDGVMFASPATGLNAVIDSFGDGFFIGGIDAGILTKGRPEDVREHVHQIADATKDQKGYALCCSGGLVGNMPLQNLEAYFDARIEHGYTKPGWRHAANAVR